MDWLAEHLTAGRIMAGMAVFQAFCVGYKFVHWLRRSRRG
jgi:hypothetical protein